MSVKQAPRGGGGRVYRRVTDGQALQTVQTGGLVSLGVLCCQCDTHWFIMILVLTHSSLCFQFNAVLLVVITYRHFNNVTTYSMTLHSFPFSNCRWQRMWPGVSRASRPHLHAEHHTPSPALVNNRCSFTEYCLYFKNKILRKIYLYIHTDPNKEHIIHVSHKWVVG